MKVSLSLTHFHAITFSRALSFFFSLALAQSLYFPPFLSLPPSPPLSLSLARVLSLNPSLSEHGMPFEGDGYDDIDRAGEDYDDIDSAEGGDHGRGRTGRAGVGRELREDFY